MEKRNRLLAGLFALALCAFSLYALLDAFVITRVYAAAEAPARTETTEETPAVTAAPETAAARLTDSSYEDETLSIRIDTARVGETTVYAADVRVSDPQRLKSAFAQGLYGRNVTAASSAIAAEAGAILAVNGDNYGSREKGYVIRNGVLYRDEAAAGQEDLVIWADGSFSLIEESEITAQELLAQGAQQVFSFGPALLRDGEICVSEDEEVGRAKASNPRTAIGLYEDGHYLLLVADGRTEESEGLSLYELAAYLQSLGVKTAYNLDGGGSSTMVFNGTVVNRPTSGRGVRERAVTDVLYLA